MQWRHFGWHLGALMIVLAGCTLTSNPVTPTPSSSPTPIGNGKPVVTITTPADGTEFELGDPVAVSAVASDAEGITRAQVYANGVLVRTSSATSPSGDRTLAIAFDYAPRTAGELELEIIAYRGGVASDPARVSLSIVDTAASQPTLLPTTSTGGGGLGSGVIVNPNDPTCRVLTDVSVNYRNGPGTGYTRLGTLAGGTEYPIVGRVGDNSWWQIQLNSFTSVWVSAEFTTVYGNCTGIPVVNPPTATAAATTTPVPSLTYTVMPTLAPSVTPPRAPADLTVTNITGPSSVTLSSGSATARYSVVITNTGGSAVGQFDNAITYLPGGTNQALGVVADLSPGQSITLSVDLVFTSAGTATIQATADSANGVSESSEVNNVGILVVQVN
ncbi:MAG: CARDB domain-containing protein [Phototrophicaceae bacterium]|jgi:hypothetical protein